MTRLGGIDRRRYLEAVGTLGTGAALGLAGCSDFGDEPDEPDEPEEPNGNDHEPEVPADEYEPARTPPVEEIPEGGTGVNFELVGHNPLYDDHQYRGDSLGLPRGSNGDITIAGDYVYVGSFVGHQPPLIVDISDPTDPEVVGPVPDAVPGVANGMEGIEASGDVLVIDQREPQLGFDVPEGMPERGLAVYDVSTPREPHLVARYDYEGLEAHALTLWRDPEDPNRLLGIQTFEESPHIQVVDLTGCPDDCEPEVVAQWDLEAQTGIETDSHEAIMSTDGDRIYVAQRSDGLPVLDSSGLMDALRNGEGCDPTPAQSVPGDGHCLAAADPDLEATLEAQPDFSGAFYHTPLKVPDRPYLLVTSEHTDVGWDEEAGEFEMGHCPGAETRLFPLDEERRRVGPEPDGTYGLPEQDEENCTEDDEWEEGTAAEPAWLSPHFPLAFRDVAFSTYYSAGFRAIDISDASNPREIGHFFNEPVEDVRWASFRTDGETEYDDDGNEVGQRLPQTHMFAFSYPVVHDGYIVYADIHSGLYVLEYTGPHADGIPEEGICHPANPGAVEPGYEPCPPYGDSD